MHRVCCLITIFLLVPSSNVTTHPRVFEQLPEQTGVDPSLPITYFGGTTWNPDSSRWEALPDSVWTFDSGVGSHFNHVAAGIQSKESNLHALMEGWMGLNFNEVAAPKQAFRRLEESDFTGAPHICVGDVAGLGGDYSFWAGLLPSEGAQYGFANSMGYGNGWLISMQKTFYYGGAGSVQIAFDYSNDTEEGFDQTWLTIHHSGGEATLRTYTGRIAGHETILLQPGQQLPAVPDSIRIRYQVVSDSFWSDEDGLYDSMCGAFAVDDIALTGAIQDLSTFENGNDGWTVLSSAQFNAFRDWANIVALSNLPALETSGPCALRDSVLVFTNLEVGGHLNGEDNVAVSPWIDLKAAGLVGAPQKLITFDVYGEPILGGGFAAPGEVSSSCPGANNTVFVQVRVQWSPYRYENGAIGVSPWMWGGSINFPQPRCTADNDPSIFDVSHALYAGAEQVRIALGVWRNCFPNLSPCPCQHPSPYFDNVQFGVAGEGTALPSQEAPPAFDLSWGSSGTGPGEFTRPSGIAVDSGGNVYVSDRHRIQKFTALGAFIKSWGDSGAGRGQFNLPHGIALDSQDHLYVCDFGNDRIQKFTSNGQYLFAWNVHSTHPTEATGPIALAVDSQDRVYVLVDEQVKMFSSQGGFLASWESRSGGIEVGTDNRVYVADGPTATLTVHAPDHTVERVWRSAMEEGGWPAPSPYPGSLGLTADGQLLIGDRVYQHITKFSPDGFLISHWGSKGTGNGQFEQLGDIAVDHSGQHVYVTDFWANKVQRFSYSNTGTPDQRTPAPIRMLPPVPNPAHGHANLTVVLPQSSEYELAGEVFDLAGRRVNLIPSRRVSGGEQRVVWDGSTLTGGRVGPGLYLIRIRVDRRTIGTAKLIYFPN